MAKKKLESIYSSVDEKKYLTKREYVGTGISAAGNSLKNSIGTFTSLIAARFLGLTQENYAILATVTLVLSFWDIINDVIIGNYIDKHTTKWGKFKPFIFFAALPLMLIALLQWLPINDINSSLSQGFKMAYVIILYLLNDFFGTFSNAATNGLNSRITPSNKERGFQQLLTSVIGSPLSSGATAVMMFIPKIFASQPEATQYFIGMALCIVIGTPMSLLLPIVTKERIVVAEAEDKPKLREVYRDVLKNRPLMSTVISDILASGLSLAYFAYVFVCRDLLSGIEFNIFGYTYVTEPASIMLVISILCGIPTFLSIVIAPLIRKYIDDRTLMIASRLVSGFCFLLIFVLCLPVWELTPKQYFYRIVIPYAFHGVTTGFYNVIPNLMAMDALDYGEWKTGHRTEATVYAVKGFLSRIAGSVVNWVGSLLLVAIAYPTNDATAVISKSTQEGLVMMFSLIPGLFALAAMVPLFFFNYVGKYKREIQVALEERRAEIRANEHK